MRMKGWLENVRERLRPVAYVDWADTPDEPHSPYRARITVPALDGVDEPDVLEREVVRGSCKTIYEIRCQCGRRWFIRRLEHVQICPRCARAVLVTAPESDDRPGPVDPALSATAVPIHARGAGMDMTR